MKKRDLIPLLMSAVVLLLAGVLVWVPVGAPLGPVFGQNQNFSTIGQIVGTLALNCAGYAGATPDVKIAACAAAESASGGVLSLEGFSGTQTIASTVTFSIPNTTILIPDGVTFVPASASVTGFASVTAANVNFQCKNRSTITFDWSAVNVTGGTTTSIINVTGATASGFTMNNCHLRGDRVANGDTGGGQECIRVSPGAANLLQNIFITNNYVEQCASFGINVNASSVVYITSNLIVQTSGAGVQVNTGTIVNQEYRGWFVNYNTSYDDNTANLAGTAHLNLINPNFATPVTAVNAQVIGNEVYNDIAGGDHNGNAVVCNATANVLATGCFQGIEVNNVADVQILGNHLRNMNGEAISTMNGGGRFVIAENDISLAGVNVNLTPSTVTTAGAGAILLFWSNNNPTYYQNTTIDVHDNTIFDSGYCVGMSLGASVTVTTVAEGPVNIHDNQCRPVAQSVIRGYRLINLTGTNCSGALCTYTINNVLVHDNTFTGWSTSGFDFTDENGGNSGTPQVYNNNSIVGTTAVAQPGGMPPFFTTLGYCNSTFSATAGTYALFPFETNINTDACGTVTALLQAARSAVAAPIGICTVVATGTATATNSVTVTFTDNTSGQSVTSTVAASSNNHTNTATLTGGIGLSDAYSITVTVGATETWSSPRVMVACW